MNTCSLLRDLLSEPSDTTSLWVYPPGNTEVSARITHCQLRDEAKRLSASVHRIVGFQSGSCVVLYLDDQWDNLLWFWAVVLAGGIPIMSPPFSQLPHQRQLQVRNIAKVLENPVCLTRENLRSQFASEEWPQINTLESLEKSQGCNSNFQITFTVPTDICMMMMTSGSTGIAKVVPITHKQIFAALSGKSFVRQLPQGKPFLNWIGIDHVASLVEIHLQALWLGVDQIHVHTADVVSSPWTLIELLSRHQVSRSFAPNFMLASLVAAAEDDSGPKGSLNLEYLTLLASGGELNAATTCVSAARLLSRFGAPENAIAPGFGMTETCAGAIFNLVCPSYELEHDLAYASLGHCMPGIEFRINCSSDIHGAVMPAPVNKPGYLEVRGEVVFQGYHGNNKATASSFTLDGWFRTGDEAFTDACGHLRVVGRSQDVININGVKYSPTAMELAIEKELRHRISRAVCFPARTDKWNTERTCVAYVPKVSPELAEDTLAIQEAIIRIIALCTSSTPIVFWFDDVNQLPITTLGKVSRTGMRQRFEMGLFDSCVQTFRETIKHTTIANGSPLATSAERSLASDFANVLNVEQGIVNVHTSMLDLGVTSMDIMRLRRHLEKRLRLKIPIITLMTYTTPRTLSKALTNVHSDSALERVEYDPVVTLRRHGDRNPLWLVHPGVGEILVFVGLAQQLEKRPIFALRARGFDGHQCFGSVTETIEAYYCAIKQKQPHGPYALVGYSYGAMIAFELSKLIERENQADRVCFLGSLNLPPHIKARMRQLSWNNCLIHLAYFLDLVRESYANEREEEFRQMAATDATSTLLEDADHGRMEELGLDRCKLQDWTNIAYHLQKMAIDYEPTGKVSSVDVFHAIPLKGAANSHQDWVDIHLGKWADFSQTRPIFHAVEGAHYTMLSAEYVHSFSQILESALRARGL